ncbi:SpoIIE family protein phosphatase [candidate division KSB1 bacterium]|nr:SpoIIE family protein phosphatase [candidate division KSB1 bacterium]NIR69606.1 SpoIIE family protein phosphatase [candidate division KSB1 bacterium]NIS24323.1 SpoIIE family protein phosphatase [candidate division KSB1 bacterium]NIT71251.1 SpoIIE family protein phosphatase [candidate division KSB1 bacterium]NIU24955.1 SpoIIE family protein phosphatase [candidate division KSB1 bacterium]
MLKSLRKHVGEGWLSHFRFTLRSKLIAFSVLLVTLIMADVTYFFTIRQLRDKRSAFELQMKRIAENIATMNLLDRENWSDYQDYISRLMDFNDDIVYIAIYDERNWLRAHTLNTDLVETDRSGPLSRRVQADMVRQLDSGSIAEESREDLRVQKVNIQSGDRVLGSVHVGFSLIEINNELRSRVMRNIGMAILLILLYSVISVFLSRRLTRPLERLSQAMASISKGHLDQKVEVENRDEIGQLANTFNHMVEGLRERDIIEKLGRDLSQSFRLERMANLVQNRLSEAIGAERARLFLRQQKQEGAFYEIVTGNGVDTRNKRLELDGQSRGYLENQTDGFFLQSAPQPVRNRLKDLRIDSHELIIPMLIKKQLFGVLVFCMKQDTRKLDESQRHFASILASQAAMALENALLYDELREQERVKRELEIAREVQHKLLPRAMPHLPGFEFDGVCQSALEVGGDYFDFFHIQPGKLGIVIADVSGKGTSASFYMAEIKGMMSTLVTVYESPKKLLEELNKRLCMSLDRKMFATMIYGVLDVTSRSFAFVRAGHNSLLHISESGDCALLTPSGIGLGLDDSDIFAETLDESVISINKGDNLLFFTDGITESMNHNREEFGEDRLLNIIRSNGASNALSLREKIFGEIETFVNGAKQHDDLTMVVVHCAG